MDQAVVKCVHASADVDQVLAANVAAADAAHQRGMVTQQLDDAFLVAFDQAVDEQQLRIRRVVLIGVVRQAPLEGLLRITQLEGPPKPILEFVPIAVVVPQPTALSVDDAVDDDVWASSVSVGNFERRPGPGIGEG